MARELFGLAEATPASTDMFAFGTGATLAKNIQFENLRALLFDTSWTVATLNSGYVHIPGDQVSYRLNKLNQIELKGSFTIGSTPGSTILFAFPYTDAPAATRYFNISGIYSGTRTGYFAKMLNNGQVSLHDDSAWDQYSTFTFNNIILR